MAAAWMSIHPGHPPTCRFRKAYSPSKVIHRWRGAPAFAAPQPTVNNFGWTISFRRCREWRGARARAASPRLQTARASRIAGPGANKGEFFALDPGLQGYPQAWNRLVTTCRHAFPGPCWLKTGQCRNSCSQRLPTNSAEEAKEQCPADPAGRSAARGGRETLETQLFTLPLNRKRLPTPRSNAARSRIASRPTDGVQVGGLGYLAITTSPLASSPWGAGSPGAS
jgi:hypothetical protein